MEENKFNKQETDGNTYRKVYNDTSFSQKNKSSFGKSILLPFCSGIIGCTLVLGTCFGVPSIKSKLLGTISTSTTYTNSSNNLETSTNNNFVSLSNYSDTSVYAANKILPSIVGIEVEYTVTNNRDSIFSMFGSGSSQSSTATASGSGIIISSDGYILTNNHVVDTSSSSSSSSFYQVTEANKVYVKLYNDDTKYEATIIGKDSQTDLAVIKVDKNDLTAAEMGNSDSLKVGEFVMAVGNPLNLDSSITCGVVSSLNREVKDSDGNTYTMIQTDSAINSGNSGGALVNSQGQVVGINSMKVSSYGVEGIGFAIPINSALDIKNQLIEYNKVKRPFIGISGISVTEQQSKSYNLPIGVYIKSVEEFSAAEKAGLQIGDVIIEADGKAIKTMDELNSIKNSHQIGDTITLKINRNGNEKTVSLTLGEQ